MGLIMTDERIDELLRFKTKDYRDCPILSEEQLKKLKPRYSSFIPIDGDVLEWLKKNSTDGDFKRHANLMLREAMEAAL
jgi:hypothetical protein